MFKKKLIVSATLLAMSNFVFASPQSFNPYNSNYLPGTGADITYLMTSQTSSQSETLLTNNYNNNYGVLSFNNELAQSYSQTDEVNMGNQSYPNYNVLNFKRIILKLSATNGYGGNIGNFNNFSSNQLNCVAGVNCEVNVFNNSTTSTRNSNSETNNNSQVLKLILNNGSLNLIGNQPFDGPNINLQSGSINFGLYAYNNNGAINWYAFNTTTTQNINGALYINDPISNITSNDSNITIGELWAGSPGFSLNWYLYGTNNVTIKNYNSSFCTFGYCFPSNSNPNPGSFSTINLYGEGGQNSFLYESNGATNINETNVSNFSIQNLGTGTLNLNGGGATILSSGASSVLEGYVNNNSANVYFPNSTLKVDQYNQTSGNLFLPFGYLGNGSYTTAMYAANYNINSGNVYVVAPYKAYSGRVFKYSKSDAGTYELIGTGQNAGYTDGNYTNNGQYVFSPNNLYYIYNGSDVNLIGSLTPSVFQYKNRVYLKLTAGQAPSPAPAPTPAPSPTPAPTPAPVKVHVIIPAQEVQQINATSVTANIAFNRDISASLISTGIAGGGPRGAWAKGLGGFSNYGQNSGTNMGTIFGYGHSYGPQKRDIIGISGSYGSSQFGMNSTNYASSNSYGIWLYDTFYPHKNRDWKFVQVIGGGVSTNNVSSQEIGLPVYSKFGGNFFSYQSRASYWIKKYGLIISPRITAGYEYDHSAAFKTNAAISALNANVSSVNESQFNVDEAVLIGKKYKVNHTDLFPNIRLGVNETIGATPTAIVSANNITSTITGQSYPHTQGMAEMRLDMKSKKIKGLSGNISAKELFGGGSATEFVAAIKYRW